MNEANTIVFAPISIRNGMAGAKRLGNLVQHLKQSHRIINLYRLPAGLREEEDGVQYRPYRFLFGEIMHLLAIKKEMGSKKFVYYHYGYPSIKNILNLLLIWLMGYDIFLDIVEDYHAVARYKKGFIKKLGIYFSIWLLKRSSLFASGYIAISRHLNAKLHEMFHRHKKILLLPISVNTSQYSSSAAAACQRTSFFYGGSFAPKDDFEVMLESFINVYERYPGKVDRLYLAGKCPAGKQQQIKRVAGLNNPDRIQFLGYLNDEQYFHFISTMNVLVMPRNKSDFANTGFPFKLGEYMATGNCVISARLPSVVEMIGERALVYYTPEDVESLTKALSFSITNADTCRLYGDNARRIAFEKFDAKEHVRVLNEFLMNE